MSTRIRPFVEEDVPRIVDLHRRVWPDRSLLAESDESYSDYFAQTFLHHPWKGGPLCALVHEDGSEITGFIGSMPRQMRLDGGRLQLRVASQLIVDPGKRGFAGIQLARKFLDGPQDLSLTDEANATARRIWERLGSVACPFHSLRWIAVLQPCRLGLFAMERALKLPAVVARALGPFARGIDRTAFRLPKNPLRPVEPRLGGAELDSETLTACLSDVANTKALRPEYDQLTVDWLLQRASRISPNGRLKKTVVRDHTGRVAGWYIYQLHPRGLSEVLQLCAREPYANDVVERLLHDAWTAGAVALTGRPESNLLQTLADKHCLFWIPQRQRMFIHSRRPELINLFLRGDAFFSRLDGEWSLHFR
ncbi:MAG TPA: hypothetical protein VFY29_20005 [Terriglobia bacterium]|nr:hypothetical protein [Terriglobia bacterium]